MASTKKKEKYILQKIFKGSPNFLWTSDEKFFRIMKIFFCCNINFFQIHKNKFFNFSKLYYKKIKLESGANRIDFISFCRLQILMKEDFKVNLKITSKNFSKRTI